jgi:hypothetical protein
MTMEADLVAVLRGLCPKVHPDVAPQGSVPPWVTYQQTGGQPLRYVDNQPMSLRHTRMQIDVWHTSRAAALVLIRQIEEALAGAAAFTARPDSEPVSNSEPDLGWYNSQQDFEIWAART